MEAGEFTVTEKAYGGGCGGGGGGAWTDFQGDEVGRSCSC